MEVANQEQVAPLSIEQRITNYLNTSAEPDPAESGDGPAAVAEPAKEPAKESAAAEPVSTPAESESAEEYIEVADLDGLAAHLGVDPADLYNVAIPHTVNGERREFTLGEIKDRFTDFEETAQIREQATKQIEVYRKIEQEARQVFEDQSAATARYVQAVEQMALQPFASINWDALRLQNPGEFITKSQQLHQVQQHLMGLRQQAAEAVESAKKKFDEQRQAIGKERELREQQALLKAIPEWRDPKVADAERLELAEFMLSRGYTVDEIEAVDDHRALLLVRDAMMARKARDAGAVAAKKVVKLAKKLVKPGSRASGDGNKTQAAVLAKAHRENPGSTDIAAARIALKLGRK